MPPPRLPGWSGVRNQNAASCHLAPAPLVGVERGFARPRHEPPLRPGKRGGGGRTEGCLSGNEPVLRPGKRGGGSRLRREVSFLSSQITGPVPAFAGAKKHNQMLSGITGTSLCFPVRRPVK